MEVSSYTLSPSLTVTIRELGFTMSSKEIYVVKRSENGLLHMAMYVAQVRLSRNDKLKRDTSKYIAYA